MPEGSLERVEQRCLMYLRQVKNPLVPLQNLVDYCRREEPDSPIQENVLLVFLRNHADIEVIDGPLPGEPIDSETLADAGIVMGIRVILKERLPSRREMEAIFVAQVQSMQQQLAQALSDAHDAGNEERAAKLRDALQRTDAMRERIADVLGRKGTIDNDEE